MSLLTRYGLPPAEIEARSLALVEKLAGDSLPADPLARRVAVMMLYATGDPGLADQIRIHPDAVAAGLAALRRGGPIVTDVRMVAAAVESERLNGLAVKVFCAVDRPAAASLAAARGITRTAAGIQTLLPELTGALVAIGNAPTGLLALLDGIDAGLARPALIVGTPVGLVSAAESKAELIAREVPYVTVLGTRGGSAIAAAAVNALVRLATEDG